jgi:intracellular sulfur oxidation DsrE/DsrF family protein
MYLWPTNYTLENTVNYKNSNERYEFSIRAARNISKLRGQREIEPVSSNPGIRNIYVRYLWPTYYTLENIVHYENSNERYKFSIRAARNISNLRGQREIKPVSLNQGIRNIYISVAYILCLHTGTMPTYYALENIVHYENSNERYFIFSGILCFHNIPPDIILSGML